MGGWHTTGPSEGGAISHLWGRLGILLLRGNTAIWNLTQIGIWLKLEFGSIWNLTQIGILLKLEFNTNWNLTQIEI